MAGVLNFQQFIGGPDEVKVEAQFPSTQRTMQYNFGRNISDWTFELDHQTLVVNSVAFDRNTGEPNFANSQVIGFFPKVEIDVSTYVNVVDSSTGIVNITFPGNMYTGPILPDARANVPLTVVGVTWKTGGSLNQINTHRWVFVQNWEPDVTPASPTTSTSPLYTAI